jgi:YD repeat-containing protein
VRLTAGGVLRHRLYEWDDNGMLTARESPGKMDERYTYDDLGQLVTVVDAVSGADQAYAYDPAGNVTSMTDIDGTLWTYGAATDRNQVPWREELFGVQREEFTYDASGRVVMVSDLGGVTEYRYDGLGRLRAVLEDDVVVSVQDRDAAGAIVRRTDLGGATWEVGGWTQTPDSTVEERLLPYLTRKGTELRWHLLEFDGTAVVSARSDGTVVGRRRTGAYGQAFVDNGDPLEQAGFHGIREETELGLMAAGPRHLMRSDGMWLQPEPLLYLGIPSERLTDLRALMAYRYAGNRPTVRSDPTGLAPQALIGWELFEVAVTVDSLRSGTNSLAVNMAEGDYVGATVDGAFLVVDGLSLATPLPGMAGTGKRVASEGLDFAASVAPDVAHVVGGALSDAVARAKAVVASKYRGGAHGDVSLPAGDGLDSHHLLADAVSPFPRDKGPAIQMEPGDHRKTASWGSSAEARAFRAEQGRLVGERRVDDAIQMGIDDVTGQFPGQYDAAILEAIDAIPD